ncbi:MAG TPA: DUF2807 domain-containing protein [Brevundimonas sp.]|jgi:hypothetical protein|uniref:GIN domain-containing protein n=1 Tax=Brevundimonas sp. TaxID=1871086 RepID=UPI002E117A13|nr:DUF2807 domain-containing protein [Brevundimonas sp.]
MIRTLFLISAGAAVVAAGSLAGAAALGGADIARNGNVWTFTEAGGPGGVTISRRTEVSTTVDPGPQVTRTEAFTGGDRLILDAALDVTYVQGAAATVRLEGPQAAIDRVRIDGARIGFDDEEPGSVTVRFGPGGITGWSDLDGVRVVVTAPSVRNFEINGSGDLDVQGYDQPEFRLRIAGSGDARATGRTDRLDVDIAGSGEADLEALEAGDATFDIAGSGEIDARPTGRVEAAVSGSGDIRLRRQPASLNSNIAGSGEVRVDG